MRPPAPVQLLLKAIASGGLMAHIITARYVDTLPFCRQELQFARLGTDISRITMCRWAMRLAQCVHSTQQLAQTGDPLRFINLC
jgi:transposase